MWPSEELASRIYDWANWGLVVGLVIGIIATVLVVWMGNVKEAYLRKHLSETNERSQKLEESNLTLAGNVAILQKDASGQQERAAKAERDLLELKEKIKDRHMNSDQRAELIKILSAGPKGVVSLRCVLSDRESCLFAREIKEALIEAGWSVGDIGQGLYEGNPVGLFVHIRNWDRIPARADTLGKALLAIGMKANISRIDLFDDDSLELLVGGKERP